MNESADRRQVALVGLLQEWADWMRGYNVKTGYPRRSIGLASERGSTSFDEMCGQMDARICKAVDASVDDLPPHQQSAITHRYLASVFRFPRLEYAVVLTDAHEALLVSLLRKGIIF